MRIFGITAVKSTSYILGSFLMLNSMFRTKIVSYAMCMDSSLICMSPALKT